MDDFVERNVSTILLAIGALMVVGAAFLNMADGVKIAFAVLGVGLIVIGALARLLVEFKLTLQGIEGKFADRREKAVAIAAEEVGPAIAAAVRDALSFTEAPVAEALREAGWIGRLVGPIDKTGGAKSARSGSGSFDITEDQLRESFRGAQLTTEVSPQQTAGAAVPGRSETGSRGRGAADPEDPRNR